MDTGAVSQFSECNRQRSWFPFREYPVHISTREQNILYFQIFTAVKINVVVFWAVETCSDENGERSFFQNVGVHLPELTVSQPRRL
jgi:hypothetical protein